MTGFSDETRDQIWQRAGGLCEARCAPQCRIWGFWCHHRLLRRHGNHSTVNGLLVCTPCHQLIHTAGRAAYDAGLLVRSWANPADIPVTPGLFTKGTP